MTTTEAMKKKFCIYVFYWIFMAVSILTICSCGYDDRLRHIEGVGRIVARDSCSYIGRQAWIVNLDMSKTVLPNTSTILPVSSDTINNVAYSSLVRVFCDIKEADTVIFNNEFRLNFNPVTTSCPQSGYSLSNYDAEPDYGYSKK